MAQNVRQGSLKPKEGKDYGRQSEKTKNSYDGGDNTETAISQPTDGASRDQ